MAFPPQGVRATSGTATALSGATGTIGAVTPTAAGVDFGSASLPFDVFAQIIEVVPTTLPSAHADNPRVFAISDDFAILPGSGGEGGLRLYDPDDTTRYLRLTWDGGSWTFYGAGATLQLKGGGDIESEGRVKANALRLPEASAPSVEADYAKVFAVDESGTTALRSIFGTNSVRIAKDIAPVAFTQTYSTSTATHAAMTSADVGAFTGGVVGFLDAAERDNIRTQFNAARADIINLKGVVNALLDALQAQTTYVS